MVPDHVHEEVLQRNIVLKQQLDEAWTVILQARSITEDALHEGLVASEFIQMQALNTTLRSIYQPVNTPTDWSGQC
jgi:hypothetical protein